jgi:hypothetical protein
LNAQTSNVRFRQAFTGARMAAFPVRRVMYNYVRQFGPASFAADEAPSLVSAFLIAEFFYKFHSFALEAGAFLLTWYVLSWLQHKALALFGRS